MKISSEEKKILLEAARQSIKSEYRSVEIPKPDYDKYPLLNSLKAAFVTILLHGELRGCIGYITAVQPLFDTVVNAAYQAANHDPRFSPIRNEDIDNIEIEISVLSEFTPINSYDEIEIGKHGLFLDEGGRGLLLPQVPVEHKMNRAEYLNAICQKSGLYPQYWKQRMLNIKVFTADVFSEKGEEI